jgi:hypothetical protein
LVPAAEVSAIEVLLPKQCGHCGGNLLQKSGKVPTAGEPRRHHVTEVPPVTAQITEYQFPKSGLWALRIGDTGAAARGPNPAILIGA